MLVKSAITCRAVKMPYESTYHIATRAQAHAIPNHVANVIA